MVRSERFYKRIMIPVIHKGKIVDLYGRTVSEHEKVKHFYLYGEFVWGGIDHIDPSKVVCIFESAIDCLVAESNGLTNGIDPAGIKGSLFAGINNHVVELSEGKDVADILLNGGLEAITPYTQAATVFNRFKTFQLLKEMDIADIQAYLTANKTKPVNACQVLTGFVLRFHVLYIQGSR